MGLGRWWGRPGRRRRPNWPGPVVLALLAVLFVVAPLPSAAPLRSAAPVAAQESGTTVEASSRFVLEPERATFRAEIDLAITNDRRGSVLIGYSVPVLAEASALSAAAPDGTPLGVARDADGSPVDLVEIDLSPPVDTGETRRVRLSYDLPDQGPRSPAFTRVNEAYAILPLLALGDPGRAAVEVSVPERYEATVVGDAMVEQVEGGRRVLRATAIADPLAWAATVSARDDERLLARSIEAGGHPVEVRAWPGDEEWAAFVTDRLSVGIPALEELIGQPWPIAGTLRITESASPYLYGYAGSFTPVDDTIEVGDELDAEVVLHEASHAWFNEQRFAGRWLNEALAQEYTSRALERLGEALPAPVPVDPADPGRLPLAQWSTPELSPAISQDEERYGYNASWTALRRVVDEVGIGALSAVVAAVHDERIAYVGDQPAEDWEPLTDWRRLLDLLEEGAGSSVAGPTFAELVATEDDRFDLDRRSAARTAYQALEDLGRGWTPPYGVRLAMAEWDFGVADQAIRRATGVLEQRDALLAALAPTGVDELGALELVYETADSTRDLERTIRRYEELGQRLVAATAADDRGGDGGLLGAVGRLGQDPDTTLEAAGVALAEGRLGDAEQLLADAEDAGADRREGLRRIAVVVATALVLGVLVALRRHSRRTLAG